MKEIVRRGAFTKPSSLTKQPDQAKAGLDPIQVIAFLMMHIPLALLIQRSSLVSTAHAYLTLGLGLFFLLTDRRPERVIYMVAYITGAELLWRGTHASVFWETGKYEISIFLILALLKYGGLSRADKRPVFYFALLLPSIFLLPTFDREVITFNLAGPFALAAATMYFSTVSLSKDQLKRILIALLAPAVSLVFLASYGTLTSSYIEFASSSLFATSAGIGPNQVSTILGLGAFAALLYFFLDFQRARSDARNMGKSPSIHLQTSGESRKASLNDSASSETLLRYLLLMLSLWLMSQAMLTFSRGGVWTALIAIFVAGFYMLRNRRARTAFVFAGIFIFLLGYFVLFPALDEFAGGRLSARFMDLNTTGRLEIAKVDFQTFMENPFLGVGPGQSYTLHTLYWRSASAHTEYSRMLAEHGTLGLVALLILISIVGGRFFRRTSNIQKVFALSLTMWALVTMLHSATRLVAPAFTFGLAAATFLLDNKAED